MSDIMEIFISLIGFVGIIAVASGICWVVIMLKRWMQRRYSRKLNNIVRGTLGILGWGADSSFDAKKMNNKLILGKKEIPHSLPKNESSDFYLLGCFITGLIVFVFVWVYAIFEWGFLLGLMFGWIPAIIAAIIGGLLWPLIIIGILWLFLSR